MSVAKSKTSRTARETKAKNSLDPLAKALSRSAGQVWKIYVLRYVAKGIAELFVAGVTFLITYNKLWAHHWVWFLCIPFPVIMLLCLDAIQNIIDPGYPAIGDVENLIETTKELTGKKTEMTVYNNGNRY